MFEKDLISVEPRLRGFALRLTRNRDAADDLIQQTMLKALSNKDKFKEGTNIASWLFTIMRNEHYTNHRKRKLVADPDFIHQSRLITTPEQEVLIQFKELEKVFANLTPEHQRSLKLVVINGFSYEEAAEIEDVLVGTMKSRVSRARKAVKDQLGGVIEDYIFTGVRTQNDNFCYSNR